MMLRNVIINADDFGLSNGICRSILELFNQNAISSTTLMTAAPNGVRRIKKMGGKNLLGLAGVHLQLTGGQPLSKIAEVPTLWNSTQSKFRDLRNSSLPNLNDVRKEWDRQIQTSIDLLGGLPTHLDSHHGVHRDPDFFPIYLELSHKYEIPIRGADFGIVKSRIKSESIKGTVAIVRDWTGRSLSYIDLINKMCDIIDQNPNEKVVEVVCHPGYFDPYLSKISSLSKAREKEHFELLKLAKSMWFKKNKLSLVSFKNLTNWVR